MPTPYSKLRATMSPESRARASARAKQMIAALPLDQIRKAQEMTQIELAARLDTDQTSVSKLENREDMHLSTLREYIAALGGEMVIHAKFPNASYTVGIGKEANSK
jgi:hypothetical protein